MGEMTQPDNLFGVHPCTYISKASNNESSRGDDIRTAQTAWINSVQRLHPEDWYITDQPTTYYWWWR